MTTAAGIDSVTLTVSVEEATFLRRLVQRFTERDGFDQHPDALKIIGLRAAMVRTLPLSEERGNLGGREG